MILRASLGLLLSFFGLFVYEYVYHKFYKGRQVPLVLGIVVGLCVLSLYVCSLFAGGLIVKSLSSGMASPNLLRVGMLVGAISVAWLTSILLQVGQNIVRSLMGQPTRPIEWIRNNNR